MSQKPATRSIDRLFSIIMLVSLLFSNLGGNTVLPVRAQESVTPISYSVLYSDGSGLYALDPVTLSPTRLGPDLPVPPKFILETDKIWSADDWPFDIIISDGYIFSSGLLSPRGNQLVYVEAVCSNTQCQNLFNVWLVDLIAHRRSLILNELTDLTNHLPEPVGHGQASEVIFFDTFNIADNFPYAGLWSYNLLNEELSSVELGSGYYNSRLWLSPNRKFLLTTGFVEQSEDRLDTLGNPTSRIKLIDLETGAISTIANSPQAQNYYFVRGWIASDDLPQITNFVNASESGVVPLAIPEATSGFQRPMTNDHYGWEWVDWTGSVYHPGDDYNGPGGGDADCGTDIYAVANGTVKYVNTGVFGGIVIEHNWQGTTVYSQYGHVSYSYVSNGQNVTKGQLIADMGKVAATSCHLHWEIREADHPNPNNGDYYSNLSVLSNVENWYEDPEWWADNHGSYGGTNNCQNTGGLGIRLYDGTNCTSTEKYLSSVGFTNMPDISFNDVASSINVGDGWSARVYEHDNRGGSSRCVNGDMWDLSQDYYTSGDTGKVINNDISSIEVFNNSSCTGGSTPNVPSNLRNSSSTQTSVTMTWDDVSNESGYKIYKWDGSTFVYFASVSANVTSYTETRSTCGWDQIYDVTAFNSYGESAHSDWEQGFTQSCPVLPPSLLTPNNGQFFNEGDAINLSWSATGNEYYGEIWGGPGGTLTFGWQSGTSNNIGSQWAGYTYSWHVKARNGTTESAWSSTWTFTVRPGTPSNLSATTASCSQINLNWGDNSGNEEGYKVYRNGSLIATLGSGVTSYQSTGLAGNTNYSYTVKAYRGSVESNSSNTASATTSICTVSAPSLIGPTNGQFFNEGESINLSWSATGNEYYGEIWGGPGGTLTFGWQSGTSNNIGSQWAGYTYSWHVKARNGTTESAWSSTWTFTVRPGTPSNLSATTASCSQINLSWSDNSGNEEGYKVYRSGSLIATLGSGVTSYQNTGLAGNTNYSYTVNAYRGSIESNSSNTANATTQTCSTPPSAFNKNSPSNGATNQSTSPTLSWGSSSGATSYEYCYDTTNDNACSNWTSNGASTSKVLSGLSAGATYYWHVRAVNGGGTTYSNASATTFWSFTTALNSPGAFNKSSPMNGATNQSTSPTLSWGPSSGVTFYEYCFDTTNDNACSNWASNSTSTSKALSGLSAGTTYYWHVRAVSGAITYSNGSSTAYWSFTTAASSPVQATDAWTADGNWNLKTSFNPGDPIQWVITVENTTANSATVDMIFDVTGPSGQTIKHAEYTLDTEPGVWFWAIADTVSNAVGTYTFTGSVVYQGVTTTRSTTYVVNLPSYTITGNAGVAGAVLSYTDGTVKTVTADGSGNYTITVPAGWSGTVTPYKTDYTFAPVSKSYSNVQGNQTGQNYSATTCVGCANVNVTIGGSLAGQYTLSAQGSTRQSYAGVNNGVVKINSTNAASLIGAERVIYAVNGVNTSFSEMMALPNSQLSTTYWLPWYNNVDLDTQLRFGNVSGSTATVHVFIGVIEVTPPATGIILLTGASTRVSYAGVNNGPVKIVSNVNIVAAERVIYKVNEVNTSFSEMMALPNGQLSNTYWLPWYNNVDLDTQLRFGNVSANPATVHVFIGGIEVTPPATGITLAVGASTRVSYAGVNNGPVKIVSDQNIVAAERVIYAVNGVNTSFSEMMALPNGQLSNTYWLPWYNNVDLDTQLRFGNVSANPATVHVFIGGTEVTPPAGITLAVGASTRVSYAGVSSGPVKVVSDQNIVAAERVIYKVNGVNTSFSEMMALPNSLLNATYWLPWYNNVDLDTQLRFGVP